MRLTSVLAGVWAASDSAVHYSIAPSGSGFAVSAVDTEDGEELQISGVQWDGRVLRFTTTCVSSGWRLDHVVELTGDGTVAHRYTRADDWRRVDQP